MAAFSTAAVIGAGIISKGVSTILDRKAQKKAASRANQASNDAQKGFQSDEQIRANARRNTLKSLRSATKTVFTSPVGATGAASTDKKALFGQ